MRGRRDSQAKSIISDTLWLRSYALPYLFWRSLSTVTASVDTVIWDVYKLWKETLLYEMYISYERNTVIWDVYERRNRLPRLIVSCEVYQWTFTTIIWRFNFKFISRLRVGVRVRFTHTHITTPPPCQSKSWLKSCMLSLELMNYIDGLVSLKGV